MNCDLQYMLEQQGLIPGVQDTISQQHFNQLVENASRRSSAFGIFISRIFIQNHNGFKLNFSSWKTLSMFYSQFMSKLDEAN